MRACSELYPPTQVGRIKHLLAVLFYPFVVFICREWWGMRTFARKYNRGILSVIAKQCYYKYCFERGADIPLTVCFGGPPCLPHGIFGIFIRSGASIGKNVTILHHVTIGRDTLKPSSGKNVVLEDGVFIGAGAKIIGDIKIGRNVRIGAGACVYADVPPNAVAVSSPTRIIQKEIELVNEFWNGNRRFKDGEFV